MIDIEIGNVYEGQIREGMMNPVWNILSLRCLQDIQKVSSGQLDVSET